MQAARVLMADLGSPERALFMCERVLSVSPDHSEALGLGLADYRRLDRAMAIYRSHADRAS